MMAAVAPLVIPHLTRFECKCEGKQLTVWYGNTSKDVKTLTEAEEKQWAQARTEGGLFIYVSPRSPAAHKEDDLRSSYHIHVFFRWVDSKTSEATELHITKMLPKSGSFRDGDQL